MNSHLSQISAVLWSSGLSVIIFLIFKWVSVRSVHLKSVIVWNYITCVVTGLLFTWDQSLFSATNFQIPGFYGVMSLGVLFMITFLLMGKATAVAGAAMSAVASKMSMIIPVVLAILIFSEPFTRFSILGILTAVVAVFLITYKKDSHKSFDWILVWVFLGSGLVDTGLNWVKHSALPPWSNIQFAVLTFTGAALTGLIYLGISREIYRLKSLQNAIWGILLGVINLFSIFAIYHGIDVFKGTTALFFTLNNLAVVVFSFLLGLLFKESFSRQSIFGLFLAIVAILLLT